MKTSTISARAPGMKRLPALFAIALVLAGLSLLGGRSASAQAPDGIEAVFGTVVETGDETLTISTDDEILLLTFDAESTIRIEGDVVGLDAIAVGDALAGTVRRAADGSYIVRSLLVRPDSAARSFVHVVGVVTGIEDGEVTITDGQGGTVKVDLPAGATPPEIGDTLTTVARRDRVTDRLAAQALERAEDIVDRLEKALERAEEAVRAAENETARQKLDDLKLRIQENTSRHLALVDQVRAAATAAPADDLERKFTAAQQRYEEVADRTGVDRPVVEARGVVREVTAGSVVIGLPNGGEIRVSLGAGAVTRDAQGAAAALGDFTAGTDVVVEYRPDAAGDRSASSLKAREPELSRQEEARIKAESEREFAGVVTSVQRPSADELTDAIGIVIIANERTAQKVVARVTRSTEIKVNGEDAAIGDLKAGQLAEVELLFGNVASEIKAGDPRAEERGIRGVVRKIDLASGMLAVVTGNDGDGLVELHVTDETAIERNGDRATLQDVVAGDLVLDASKYRPADGLATRLVLRSQEDLRIKGVITGVDHESGVVTVINEAGDTFSVHVTADTRIEGSKGEAITFRDLAAGYRLVDGRIGTIVVDRVARHVATRFVVEVPELATARGEVLRVDAASGTLVMVTTNGRELVLSLPVDGRVSIVKDDRQLDGLRGVESGDIVHSVAFQATSNTIVKLSLVTPGGTAVRGTVESVDAERNRIKLETAAGAGLELVAVATSEMSLDGRRIDTVRPLSENDMVTGALYVKRVAGNVILKLEAISGHTAPSVDTRPVQAEPPVIEVRIKGVIRAIDGDIWVVGDTQFTIDRSTRFEGDRPVVGAVAAAVLVRGGDGLPVATRVEVDAPSRDGADRPATATPTPSRTPPATPEVQRHTIEGLIEKISGDVWVVDGREVLVNRQTEVIGKPEVGARAGVVILVAADGSAVAIQVSVKSVAPRLPVPHDRDRSGPSDADEGADGAGDSSSSDLPAGTDHKDDANADARLNAEFTIR